MEGYNGSEARIKEGNRAAVEQKGNTRGESINRKSGEVMTNKGNMKENKRIFGRKSRKTNLNGFQLGQKGKDLRKLRLKARKTHLQLIVATWCIDRI